MVIVTNHDELLSQEDWANSERLRDLRSLIHDTEVKLEAEKKIVVHLEASRTIHVIFIERLLNLLH